MNEELELNIPSGVTEDYALQFKGKGNQFGRVSGDLLIRLSVSES
jgi:DnaJ-class molecular chaperone